MFKSQSTFLLVLSASSSNPSLLERTLPTDVMLSEVVQNAAENFGIPGLALAVWHDGCVSWVWKRLRVS